jgi:hypothetical protein
MPPERERFRREWLSILLFLLLVALPTFWALLGSRTRMQAAIGTGILSAVVGLNGTAFCCP